MLKADIAHHVQAVHRCHEAVFFIVQNDGKELVSRNLFSQGAGGCLSPVPVIEDPLLVTGDFRHNAGSLLAKQVVPALVLRLSSHGRGLACGHPLGSQRISLRGALNQVNDLALLEFHASAPSSSARIWSRCSVVRTALLSSMATMSAADFL